MILRKPSYTFLEQSEGLEGIKRQIEVCGRTCYKSLDKMTDTSAEKFVNNMINRNHGAMLEHGTVYLMMDWNTTDTEEKVASIKYQSNKFSHVNYVTTELNKVIAYVTTNYRVLVENNWLDDLKYLCKETEYHEKRVTVKFEMDRIGSQSVVRHRVMSFGQESTRYCNYKLDKFGHEIKISKPKWVIEHMDNTMPEDWAMTEEKYKLIFAEFLNAKKGISSEGDRPISDAISYWLMANEMAEFFYFKLIDCGLQAQNARAVLPVDLDTEIVVTGFVSDWKHFFDLRADNTTGPAHPDINMLTKPLKEDFIKRGYLPEEIEGEINS